MSDALKHMALKSAIVLTAFVAIAFAAGSAKEWYETAMIVPVSSVAPGVIHRGDGVPIAELRAGETYYVDITVTRRRTCRIDVQARITRVDGKPFDYYYPQTTVYGLQGQHEVNEAFVLPSWLPPGEYQHVRNGFYSCGDLRHVQVYAPIRFRVG